MADVIIGNNRFPNAKKAREWLAAYFGYARWGLNRFSRPMAEFIAENHPAVSDYKGGKEQALQFLVGKAMGKLRGRGNPEQLKELKILKLILVGNLIISLI